MSLRVLVVEDSEFDTALVVRNLSRDGKKVEHLRVETADELRKALATSPWDVVISDFNLPQFSANAALEIFQESGLDIPFIIVSGTIGEENAVALMKAGAQDYVRKENLARLAPVVQRELQEAMIRKVAREAQAVNQEILSALSSHIALLDKDGVVVATNDAWSRFAQQQGPVDFERSGVGTNYLEVCRRSTVWSHEAIRDIEAVLKGESTGFMTEYQCQCRTQQRRWFLMSLTPLTRGRGGAVVSHLDVTLRRKVEDQVRDREARLTAMLDTAAEGIITTDESGFIESFNKAAEQTFGLTHSDVLGKNVSLLMPLPDQEGRDSDMHRFAASHMPAVGGVGREVQGRRKDGTLFPMDLSLSEVRLPDRRIFTAFVRDITERKRVELALRESESNLARAQEIAHVGSYTGDVPSRGPFRWSAQMYRIVGRDPQAGDPTQLEFIEQHVHPSDRTRVQESLLRTAERGDPYDVEFRIVRPDGVVRHVHSIAETLAGPDGRPARLAGTLQDITARKQVEILRRLQLESARVLAAAQTLDEAVPELLRAVAEPLEWSVGEFWEVEADTGELRIVKAWHSPSPTLAEFVNQGWSPRLVQADPIAHQVLRTGEPLWVSSLSRQDGFPRKRTAARAHLKSALAFPVIFEKRTLAVMVFFSPDAMGPDDELLRIVGTLGGQIGQFIDRKHTADALRRSEASLARAQEIAHLGSYELVVNSPEKGRWSAEVYRILGLPPEGRLSVEQFVQDIVHVEDQDRVKDAISKVVRGAMGFDFQCRIVRPSQKVRHVKVVGEAVAARKGRTVKIVGTLMDITERVELEQEALEAREREQRRFGRDLHDGLGQRLTALELFAQALASDVKVKAPTLYTQAQNLTHHLREAVKEARLLSHGLSPVPLEEDGLMRALKEMADGTTSMTPFKCRFICRRPVLLKDVTAATQLYRIAQEAVNNAVKHSRGKTIRILMSYRSPRIELRVEDDGVGFTESGGDDTGMGLRVMKYRAEMIGATLEARPAPRHGLSIMCSLWKAL